MPFKTNICPKSKRASRRTNMPVLRTSRFQGASIRPIVPRHITLLFTTKFSSACRFSNWIIFNFCRWTGMKPKCKIWKRKQTNCVFHLFSYKPTCLQEHVLVTYFLYYHSSRYFLCWALWAGQGLSADEHHLCHLINLNQYEWEII